MCELINAGYKNVLIFFLGFPHLTRDKSNETLANYQIAKVHFGKLDAQHAAGENQHTTLLLFFLFFSLEIKLWHFMQIVSFGNWMKCQSLFPGYIYIYK